MTDMTMDRVSAGYPALDMKDNYLINGALDIWQRGDSFNLTNSGITADGISVFGVNTSTTIRQFVENGITIVQGKPLTYSFYLYAAVGSPQIGKKMTVDTCDDLYHDFTILVGWNRYTMTFSPDDVAKFKSKTTTFETGALWFDISIPDVTTDVSFALNFTGFKLESSWVATPYKHDNYTIALSKCQRYYQRGLTQGYSGGEQNYLGVEQRLPTQMRKDPTLTFDSSSPFGNNKRVSYRDETTNITAGGFYADVNRIQMDAVVPVSIPTWYKFYWTATAAF